MLIEEEQVGVRGWNELRDNVTLVGTATADNYSGHDNWHNVWQDWDWSLFVRPALGFENLATNRAGVANAGGLIECEIQPPDGYKDNGVMHHYFDPLLNRSVTMVGTWVEDKDHDSKTEIHPITSILCETNSAPGMLPTEKLFDFFAFCDTSTPNFFDPVRPIVPPHSNELRTALF